MTRDQAIKLLLELDKQEADLRRIEHRLYAIRESLARHFGLLEGEYGFREPENQP